MSNYNLHFRLPTVDLASIEDRLTTLETRISNMEDFLYLSDVETVWTTNNALLSIGVGIIHSGYTYNFWGVGALGHQQTLTNGQTYYIITANQFDALSLYQGDSTIGTLWIEQSQGGLYSMPLRFDSTGIYFVPSNNITNLSVGTIFKFTQALILYDPEKR